MRVRPGVAVATGPCSGVPVGAAGGDAGSFVWADNQAASFTTTGPNQFLVRANGGFGFNTASIPDGVGASKRLWICAQPALDAEMSTSRWSRGFWREALLATLLGTSLNALAQEATADSQRFRLSGTLAPSALSADGRFALVAEARHTQAEQPGKARFDLVSPSGTACALGDAIFANGFQ